MVSTKLCNSLVERPPLASLSSDENSCDNGSLWSLAVDAFVADEDEVDEVLVSDAQFDRALWVVDWVAPIMAAISCAAGNIRSSPRHSIIKDRAVFPEHVVRRDFEALENNAKPNGSLRDP